MIVNM